MEQLNEVNLDSNRKCAEVVFVKNPFEFWVRLEETREEYESMLRQMQEDYKHAHQDKTYDLKGASLGLGCSFNQKQFEWHRCEIQSIVKSNAYVLFIDTGETDLVPLKSIKFLKDQYKSMNRFALKCSLYNIRPFENEAIASSWSQASVQAFEKLVGHKTVSLVFKSRCANYVYVVDMFLKNVNVVDQMVREGLATVESDDADANSSSIGDSQVLSTRALANALKELEAHERFISRPKITASLVDEHEIMATHILSPYCFYVQLCSDLTDYQNFEQDMQAFYRNARGESSLHELKEPQIGQMCVARYSADGEWYRAIVKQVNEAERTCVVFFVDYGNEDTVPITDALLKINDEFKSYPMFAIKCSLSGIRPPSADLDSATPAFNAKVVDFMYEIFGRKSYAKFIGRISYSECYLVEMSIDPAPGSAVGRCDLATMLIEKGMAIRKPSRSDVQLNQAYEATVTQIYSPYYFYIQVNDQVADFEAFAAELQAYYASQVAKMPEDASIEAKILIKKPRIGQLCVARFSEDDQLYRAVVKEITTGHHKAVRVFFIDYGNEDLVSLEQSTSPSLFKIAEKFKDYPAMAYKCCLHGVQPAAELKADRAKQAEIADFMYESIVERAVVKLLSKSVDDCYLVELSIESDKKLVSFAEMLIEKNYAIKLSLSAAGAATSETPEERRRRQEALSVLKPVRTTAVEAPKQQASSSSSADSKPAVVRYYKQPELTLQANATHTFLITCIETVKSFYVRLHDADSASEMRRISSDLQYFYEKKINLSAPVLAKDNACAYYDDEKKSWHRAKIVQVLDEEHCTVRLVDLGAIRYVNKAALKELYDKYLEPACQAAWASLNDLSDVPIENIDEKCNIKFKEMATNKPFFGKVVRIQASPAGPGGDAAGAGQERKYLLNLFESNGDSIYSTLTTELDMTMSEAKFKPAVKSKLEETTVMNADDSVSSIDQSIAVAACIAAPHVRPAVKAPLAAPTDMPDSRAPVRAMATSHAAPDGRMQADKMTTTTRPRQVSEDESPFPKHDHSTSVVKPGSMSILTKFAPTQQPEPAPVFNPVFQPTQKPAAYKDQMLPGSNPAAASGQQQALAPPNDQQAIMQQANETDIKRRMMVVSAANKTCLVTNNVFDVEVANMDDGLKYIYFHMLSSKPALKRLEADLEADAAKSLKDFAKVGFMDLKFNAYYLVRYLGRLYRAKLLAPSHKLTLSSICETPFVVQLVDYGAKVRFELTRPNTSPLVTSASAATTATAFTPTVDIQFYQMTAHYQRFHTFALHCRLPLAHAIENTWNAAEKAKFLEQIQVGRSYKIKILTPFEPYVFEFHNEDKSIQFQFDDIIARLNGKNKLDPPTFIAGTTHLVSSNELFAMTPGTRQLALDHFYIHSIDHTRLNELRFMVTYLNDTIDSQTRAPGGIGGLVLPPALKLTSIKLGDVILGRPKKRAFLDQLSPGLKALIAGKWSRLEVKAITTVKADQKRLIRLLFLDYGIEDVVADQLQTDVSYMDYGDYDLINVPVHFKIWPSYAYRCSLDLALVKRKCAEAGRQHDFFDLKYLVDNLARASEHLSSRTFKADFSANFDGRRRTQASEAEAFVVDLVDSKTETNLVDVLIQNALAGISSAEFPVVVVHAVSIDDFYVQKFDDDYQNALSDLQLKIHSKVLAGELKQLRMVELHRICIAQFDEDGVYYRAKIIDKPSNMAATGDALFTVQYIDYGNTSQVALDKLREIPAEFVDNLPQSFAIQCQLNLPDQAGDRAELQEYFFEKLNDFKFYLKCHERLARAKHTDGNKFAVDLYESESRTLIQDLLRQVGNSEDEKTATILSNDDEDDAAIAEENTHLTNNFDPTGLDMTEFNSTNMTAGRAFDAVDHRVRAVQVSSETIKAPGEGQVKVELSWSETDPNIRNYDWNNDTYQDHSVSRCHGNNEATESYSNEQQRPNDDQRESDHSLLYSTANDDSMRLASDVTDAAGPGHDETSKLTFTNEPVRRGRLTCKQQKQYSYRKNPDDTDEDEDDDDDDEDVDGEQGGTAKVTAPASATGVQVRQVPSSKAVQGANTPVERPDENSQPPRRTIDYDDTCTSGHLDDDNGNTCTANESVNTTGPRNTTVPDFPNASNWTATNKSTLDTTGDHPRNRTVDEFPGISMWEGKPAEQQQQQQDESLSTSATNIKNVTVDGFADQSSWKTHTSLNETGAGQERNTSVAGFGSNSVWSVAKDATLTEETETAGEADQSSQALLAKTINEEANLSVWTSDAKPTTTTTTYEMTMDGYVIHVNSLENFYVQALDADNTLMNMKSKIDACKIPMPKIAVGVLCVAKYHVDDLLYRAKVLECATPSGAANTSVNSSMQSKIKVHYIDYGNEDYVDPGEVFTISAHLREQVPLAKECQLCLTDQFKAFMDTCSGESQARLLALFKDITSQLPVKLKVRKVRQNIVTSKAKPMFIHDRTLITDLFVSTDAGSEPNICDYILDRYAKECPKEHQSVMAKLKSPRPLDAPSSLLQPAAAVRVVKPAPVKMTQQFQDQLTCLLRATQFDAVLVNYEPFTAAKCDSIELRLVNLDILAFIDSLLEHVKATQPDALRHLATGGHQVSESGESSCCYFVELPDELASLLKLKNKLGRAKLVPDETNNNSLQVHLVDFGIQVSVPKSARAVLEASPGSFGTDTIPSALHTCSLDLVNVHVLKTLGKSQVEHLNEIFKLLVNLSALSRLSATVSSKLSARISKRGSVLLSDTKRELLDVNYLMQVCTGVLAQPFEGHVSALESDLSHFDCCHTLGAPKTLKEIAKILKASRYVRNVRAKVCDANPLHVGDFCLVDESSEAMSSGPTLVDNSSSSSFVNSDSLVQSTELVIARGYVFDKSGDNHLVLDVDSGKKLVLPRRRLVALERHSPLIDLLDKSVLSDRDSVVLACSTNLVHLLPFFAVRGQFAAGATANSRDLIHKVLRSSRFFGEKVKFKTLGSTKASSSHEHELNLTPASRFIQDESSLFRIVELVDLPKTVTSPRSESPSLVTTSEAIKRKRSSTDYDPSMTSRKPSPLAAAPVVQSQHPFYFTLSYAKSVNCFYVHSNEALKNLNFTDEMIRMEEPKRQVTTGVSPEVGDIYGVYNDEDGKYCRVSLIDEERAKTTYLAFYLDHGYIRSVRADKLIAISDAATLQLAPQALCCKLVGFEHLSAPGQGELDQRVLEAFAELLRDKPFMATIYSRFLNFKRIDNYLPLQADNSKPIDVVLHLFKSDSAEACIESHDRSYVDDYNERLEDESAVVDVSDLLKKIMADAGACAGAGAGGQVVSSRRTSTSRSAHGNALDSDPSSPLLKSPQKMFKPLNLGSNGEEVRVEIANIYSPNEFYLQPEGWEERLAKLDEMMAQDYGQDHRLLYNNTNNLYCLQESDLRTNLPCALVLRAEARYARARVMSSKRKKKDGKTLTAVKIFLIDTGKTQTEPIEHLYPLLDKYYELPALSFECSLNFKMMSPADTGSGSAHPELAYHATRVFDLASGTMGCFTMSVIEQIAPVTSLPACESLARYVVHLYGYPGSDARGGGGKRVSFLRFLNEFMSTLTVERICTMSDAHLNREIESFEDRTGVPKIQVTCPPAPDEVEQQRQHDISPNGGVHRQLADSFVVMPHQHHDKTAFPFREHDLPIGKALKIQLAYIDTSRHFAITQLENIEARKQFLGQLQAWHKEHRDKLRPVFAAAADTGEQVCDESSFIGTPCVVKSTQLGGKWCRGFVSHHPLGANFSYIYLIDYSKSVQVTNDRVYQLTHPPFLNEPATVNRCQLVDNLEQKAKFEKYENLINVHTPLNTPPSASAREHENSANGDHNSSSYISLDNVEIQIRCVERKRTPLNQMTKIENFQHVVEIVEMKRIKCSFPQSPILKVHPSNNTPLHTKTVTAQFQLRQQKQQMVADEYDENDTSIQTHSLTLVETLTNTEREFDRKNNVSYRKSTTMTNGSKLTINGSAIQGIPSAGGLHYLAPAHLDGDNTISSLVAANDLSSVCESTRIGHAYDMSQSLGSDRTDTMPLGK